MAEQAATVSMVQNVFFMVKIQMYVIFIHNPPPLGENKLLSDAFFWFFFNTMESATAFSEA